MVQKGSKLLLFIFIIFVSFNVFATDIDVTTNCYGTTGYSSMYDGHEVIYQSDSLYSFGTTYDGQLSSLETELRYSLAANTDYTISFLTNNSDDFRNTFFTWSVYDLNHNNTNLVTGFSFVSMRKVSITFRTTSATNKVKIQIGSRNLYESITGVNNWNIKKVVLSSASASATEQDIINNNNQNTQDIINNNNTNTQDIINNNDTNTQDIINNNNANTTCPVGPYRITKEQWSDIEGKYLSSDGMETSNSAYSITPYLVVKPNTQYKIFINAGTMSGSTYYCLYSNSKSVRSCSQLISSSSFATIEFTTDSSTAYLRLSLPNSRIISLEGPICNDWQRDGLTDIADAIKSDNVDSSTGSDFFNDFTSTDNGGISSIVTKPLAIVNYLLENNNSCTDLSLPSFMGVSNASLPSGCILWNRASSTITNLWNAFVCGLGSYYILKDLFKIIEKLKNPDNDSVEVIDL